MINSNKSPQAISKHIVLIGDTNAGKSSLLNALCEQDMALVSEQAGTTTDPVRKSYELLPYGPVVWIDTPGLSDDSSLGPDRMKRTVHEMEIADFAIHIVDVQNAMIIQTNPLVSALKIPVLQVYTKADCLPDNERAALISQFPAAVFVSIFDLTSIQNLRQRISDELTALSPGEPLILADKLKKGDHIILVVPIDSEAPKGRIIAPQTALLREALDHGIICSVCRPDELRILTNSPTHWDWIITDSQSFKEVDHVISLSYPPNNRPRLTSFSILMSRQKGDLKRWIDGVQAIEHLQENDKILISEACSHNRSHEDIARVKIPQLLSKHCNKTFRFEYSNGKHFPEQLDEYALIIHCGGCMITGTAMTNRIRRAGRVPITNFGIVLAYLSGILPKAIQDL